MALQWADEFPNDNPDLFSERPPPPEDEEIAIEVIDSFDDAAFADAVIESILPEPYVAPAEIDLQDDADVEPSVQTARRDPEELEPAPRSHAEDAMNDHEAYSEIQDGSSATPSAWDTYVAIMREVALQFGAPREIAQGMALTLAADSVARAWRVAIEGGEADFAACGGAMLDEWSAGFIAQLANAAIDPVRRELRSRGVCAFGLVAA